MPVSIFKGTIPVEDWSKTTESVLSSFNRMADINREEARYQEQQKQKREAEFMELARVNPVAVMGQKMQQKQADNIQQFISMAGDEYRKANYKPTLNQKLKIQQAKDALQSWQGNILSNQKLWQQAYDVIQKDKMNGDYDEKHFWDKTNEFYDSGILPTDLLAPKPYENVAGELAMKKYAGKIDKNITTYDKNGNAYTYEAEVVADEDERKNLMAEDMHKDVRLAASAMKEFSELPMETKKKYLDDAEENKKNAIINWWHDKYKEYYAPKLSMNKVEPIRQQGIGISSVSSIEDEPVGNVPVKSTRKDATGEALISKAPILRQGNISQATTVSISGMNEWDKNTGEKQPLKKSGEYTTLKDISIVYLPVKNDRWVQQDAYKVNGKLRPGVEIKPFVQGKSNKGRVTYFEYTPEVQDKINAAIPSTKKKISEEDFPFEWKPTESEIKPQKVKKITYTIKGKTYTHQNLLDLGYSEEQIQDAIKTGKIKK